MRGRPILLALLLAGCAPREEVEPAPAPPPDAPTDPALLDPHSDPPPPPGAFREPKPPPPPAPPAPASPGAPVDCPPGMLAMQGGAASLGEDAPALLDKYGPNTVVPLGTYTLAPFCIDAWPVPGGAGTGWPTDGLSKPQVREAVEPFLWRHGRRLCTVAELMFAAAGPSNLRYPWGSEPKAGVCDSKDAAPSPMGTFPECVSPRGLREVQVRSTWARLDPTTLAALTAAGAANQPGFDDGYAVWGGLVRDDTYYAPSNFGVHFHQAHTPGFNDDGLRTCAWPGAVDEESARAWAEALDRVRERALLSELTRSE